MCMPMTLFDGDILALLTASMISIALMFMILLNIVDGIRVRLYMVVLPLMVCLSFKSNGPWQKRAE